MPRLGEGVIEATIITWTKKEGDTIMEDETILEIATDKVDTEIQSPVTGKVKKIFFSDGDVVPVGKTIALIETDDEVEQEDGVGQEGDVSDVDEVSAEIQDTTLGEDVPANTGNTDNFKLTPLVRNIIKKEKISNYELERIVGTGIRGKITKRDVYKYLEEKKNKKQEVPKQEVSSYNVLPNAEDEIIEMDRMRKLIANHMVESKRIAPHVTSLVESDLTDIVKWRESIKNEFLSKYNQKITYMPIIVEAVVKAIRDFPLINCSVDGDKIILKKSVNIGIATALPNGNLIVPVVKNADQYNLIGLTKVINDLVSRARDNKLEPHEITGGTFTITNLGSMGNLIGTPIINQPQVAILATGAITKKPAVVETQFGDVIAIRNKMYLSLSYDHRIVDGFLGGSFVKRVSDYLEAYDTKNVI